MTNRKRIISMSVDRLAIELLHLSEYRCRRCVVGCAREEQECINKMITYLLDDTSGVSRLREIHKMSYRQLAEFLYRFIDGQCYICPLGCKDSYEPDKESCIYRIEGWLSSECTIYTGYTFTISTRVYQKVRVRALTKKDALRIRDRYLEDRGFRYGENFGFDDDIQCSGLTEDTHNPGSDIEVDDEKCKEYLSEEDKNSSEEE